MQVKDQQRMARIQLAEVELRSTKRLVEMYDLEVASDPTKGDGVVDLRLSERLNETESLLAQYKTANDELQRVLSQLQKGASMSSVRGHASDVGRKEDLELSFREEKQAQHQAEAGAPF